nr:protein plastid transcriptionally active 10 [Tanacetum cinerariifolium]
FKRFEHPPVFHREEDTNMDELRRDCRRPPVSRDDPGIKVEEEPLIRKLFTLIFNYFCKVQNFCGTKIDYGNCLRLFKRRLRLHRLILVVMVLLLRRSDTQTLKGEDLIRESGIPYTIVMPCTLTEEPTGADLIFEQGDNITVYHITYIHWVFDGDSAHCNLGFDIGGKLGWAVSLGNGNSLTRAETGRVGLALPVSKIL